MRRKTNSHHAILGSIALYGLFIGAGGVTISIMERNKVGIIVSIILVSVAMGIFIQHDEKEQKMAKSKNSISAYSADSSIRTTLEKNEVTIESKREFEPKFADTLFEIQGNRKVFKCGNCGHIVPRKSAICTHCFSILLPLTDDEIGEPLVERYDESTEKLIRAFFNYCAEPALKNPNDTSVVISYVKREPEQPSFYKGTTLRRWRIDHGNAALAELDEGELDDHPYRFVSSDGGMRNRIFIDFSFDNNVAHICHYIDPLFGFGYAYDYLLDATEKLVLSNEHEEWIS